MSECPQDLQGTLQAFPQALQQVARALQAAFGLSLFGFDVIVGCGAQSAAGLGELQVIDINYFPSYRSPGAWAMVRRAVAG